MPMKEFNKKKKKVEKKIQIKANTAIKIFLLICHEIFLIVYFPKYFSSCISQPFQKIPPVFPIQ